MSVPEDKLINIMKELPDSKKNELLDFAEYLVQKKDREIMEALMNAPVDDEPLTPDDIESIQRAEDDIKAGRVSNAEDVYKRLGI